MIEVGSVNPHLLDTLFRMRGFITAGMILLALAQPALAQARKPKADEPDAVHVAGAVFNDYALTLQWPGEQSELHPSASVKGCFRKSRVAFRCMGKVEGAVNRECVDTVSQSVCHEDWRRCTLSVWVLERFNRLTATYGIWELHGKHLRNLGCEQEQIQ